MRTRLLALAISLVALAGVVSAVGVGQGPSGPARAVAAADFTLDGEACSPIALATALPVGLVGGCPGVRPGAAVLTPIGTCTLNFMWKGSDGDTYMGTGGHCILEGGDVIEASWDRGDGPEVGDDQGNRIGEFAYAVLDDPRDFALVRLDPGLTASPQMCHFGGPTGINSDTPALAPTLLQQYGQGVVVGQLVPGRTHVALGMPDPDHVFAAGIVLPGDSGSGVTTPDGRAVGVVVSLGLHTGSLGLSGVDAGTIGITRLSPQLAAAAQFTGTTYTLQTAPLL